MSKKTKREIALTLGTAAAALLALFLFSFWDKMGQQDGLPPRSGLSKFAFVSVMTAFTFVYLKFVFLADKE